MEQNPFGQMFPAMFKFMIYFINVISGFVMMVTWIAGFVIAKGFWSTLCCLLPFYSWYLVVEKAMIYYHLN